MTEEKTVPINVQVPKSTHYQFKMACLKLGTTMSAVLRDTVLETITIASLQPGQAGQKGGGDG